MNSNNDDFEGVNFDDDSFLHHEEERDFEEMYSEVHRMIVRIIRPPRDGESYVEGGEQSAILSDGEKGQKRSDTGKTLYRLDCGCLVEDLKDTRREGSIYVCAKHALYCRLCSCIVLPSELVYVRLNESYYHKRCALSVIRKILFESEVNPGSVKTEVIGELKALKGSILKEMAYREVKRIGGKVMDMIKGKKAYGIRKKE